MNHTILTLLVSFLFAPVAALRGEETLNYKWAGDRELKLLIDNPVEWKASDQRPAIVSFLAEAGWPAPRPSSANRAAISPRAA